MNNPFKGALDFDKEKEVEKISNGIKTALRDKVKRRGLVVAVSGGIDSSVSLALSVKALGVNKVYALLLPEKDSSGETGDRGLELVKHFGVDYEEKNIASTLEAIGCYSERDAAIKRVIPSYNDEWKSKIVITGGLDGRFNHFLLVAQAPDGTMYEEPLRLKEYMQIVAATNFKQRIRKTLEYYHADRLNYAVVGTPNRLEYDQGFFVKNGDGSADIKPIAHLYKTQVYAMAEHLGLPESIRNAPPTTDTYSLSQSQEEFYFALPYQKMDIALWALNKGMKAEDLAVELGVTPEQAEYVYKDIEAKRKTTASLHLRPQLMEQVKEIHV
ncbi:MAG: NAD synthetase [Gammaproteobacteria bacterium (ex Lamellibrachia satsuma)]|nr:MAG: NAD(+) synthase [Gammaproteobacteria bacterium (ex Lamellibrachia satsuma)]RRS32703.1 MAG: NAD synthetase [Gammaproteobacteria bacterium (ex Lamellibrachia satsuma)]RRS37388.1 MAG: NAD synthetase [Gammaproteobacteria bacterium (ex Lamellibrachia satsuma)]